MTNNKNIERYIETLKDLPQIKHAKHLKSVTSSVTTNWGAEAWSPLQISLDCYQNFEFMLCEFNRSCSGYDVRI